MKHGLLITKRGIAMVACGNDGMELRFDEAEAVEYCKQHNHEFIGFNPRLSAFVAEKSRKIKE